MRLMDDCENRTFDLFGRDTFAPKLPEPRAQRYIMITGRQVKITQVFEAYWYFAAERQKIFFRRLQRLNSYQLTEDPILASYRFTNSYRASDRVSQYLIHRVIYGPEAPSDPSNLFFRILLFKLFNKIETWEAIEKAFGTINLDSFDFERAGALLSGRQNAGVRNYSAAYIMPSCASMFGEQAKHMGHLKLLQWMLAQNYPARLKDCRKMEDAFALLRSVPSIGAFLAYQFITDLNYSSLTNFSEMEFVMAGPGALDGISKCFDGLDDVTPADVIQHMAEHQEQYFKEIVGEFDDLWGRPLQLIDCQNVFCEISKYSRVAFPAINGLSGRTRIKQKYRLAGSISRPFYPPDWGLNGKISQSLKSS